MVDTQLIWIAKKYGKHFLAVFKSELIKKGFSSEKTKVEDFVTDVVMNRDKYGFDMKDIEEAFRNSKVIAKIRI